MPLYEYECLSNRHRFERLQKVTDQPVEACEVCGERVRRVISETSFQLKGTGWYATDYKKSAAPKTSDVAESSTKTEGAAAKSESGSASED